MSERVVNPELFHLSAALLNWYAIARVLGPGSGAESALNQKALEALQLRWMLAPPVGLPRKAFTVYCRQEVLQLQPFPNSFGTLFGVQRMNFDQLMGILQFRFNLTSPGAYVLAFSQSGALTAAAADETTTGLLTLTLQNSGMAYVLFGGNGDLVDIYGLPSYNIVNSSKWQEVETVGLPVDQAKFASSSYSNANQGFVSGPVTPVEAAQRRLSDGAPPFGWPAEILSGLPAPPWVPPSTVPLIADLQNTVIEDIRQMLGLSTGQTNDVNVTLNKTINTPAQSGGGAPPPLALPSAVTYPPLSVLLLSAGSDPFNALGLGFGTVYTLAQLRQILSQSASETPLAINPGRRINFLGFMVTAEYDVDFFGVTFKAELADFITTDVQLGLTQAPTNLSASVKRLNPPLVRDERYTGTLDAQWDRPATLFPNQTVAASYAVVRSSPTDNPMLLNPTRVGGGFLPYAASLAPDDDFNAPIIFEDPSAAPPAGGATIRYSVAAQDWFGVWSPWASADTVFPPEPLITPAVTDAQLALTETTISPYGATLTVQVAYNWTTRSPKEIDILVNLFRPPDQVTPLPAQTAPAGVQFIVGGTFGPPASITFDAAGTPSVSGAVGATVTQLPAPSYSSPQQDVRIYQVVIPGFSLDFAGFSQIVAFVFAAGIETVNPTRVTTTNPRVAHVLSPVPPPPPKYDSIVWASLPDQRGISRVHLSWNTNGAPAGTNFVIYTASETGLLGSAELPPADVTADYSSRLATLRTVNLSKCRNTFRRVITIPTRLTDPEQEIELPRGTRVIHAFVITATSANNIETLFPTDASQFIAVAVPFVELPRAPRIFTRLVTNAGIEQAEIHLESREGVTPDRFVLYRTQREGLSRDVDLMGPPISNSDQAGWTKTAVDADGTWTAVFTDPAPLGSLHPWQRVFYRAVAVADDHLTDAMGNPLGALGGRSPSSNAASIAVPSPNAPSLQAAAAGLIDHADNTVLITFLTTAPTAATALGSHQLIVAVIDTQQPSAAASTTWRTAIALDLIPFATQLPGSGAPGSATRLPAIGGLTTIALWAPRPTRVQVSNADFIVAVTLTDPVGRSSQSSINVGWWN